MRVKFSQPVEGTKVVIRRNGTDWACDDSHVISCDKDMSVLKRNNYTVIMESEAEGKIVRFSDLHRHSDGSLLDGMSRPSEIAKLTEDSGALTDHGNLYNFLTYYKEMKNAGKTPIIGFEAYMEDLEGNLSGNHLVLLAKDEMGLKNLFKLASEAHEHFYRHPHVTFDMLQTYANGIIALSGCIAGLVARYVDMDQEEKAEEAAKKLQGIFGEDFYFEIQRHHIENEERVFAFMKRLAQKLGIKVVATTDAHYPNKEDEQAHEVLLCLQTKGKLSEDHFKFNGDGYYIHTSEEMEELFSDFPEALDETLNLADKVSLTLELGKQNLPVFEIPSEFKDDKAYLKTLAGEGFRRRYLGTEHYEDKAYRDRLTYEWKMVCKMGFASYFLIVWDYINWARSHDIYVGPGRGSAAGSLLSYCLGITDLDPMDYGLLFERFLNPERVSMPDIDTDFAHVGRSAVDHYVRQKYGEEKVSSIITFGTLGGKMVLKDVARVMGSDLGPKLSSFIPATPDAEIKKSLSDNPDFKALYESDPQAKKIVDIALRLEGLKRHKSVHACGRLISRTPITENIPTEIMEDDDGNKVTVTQIEGPQCEELGLLKMDFLGLKNMSAIKDTCRDAEKNYGLQKLLEDARSDKETFFYEDIPLDDRATYKMLSEGKTAGIFQLESPGMTKVVKDMLYDIDEIPDEEVGNCFERLIAAVALYRPGPMDYIPDYMEGMRDKAKIKYDCEQEREILAPTFGVMVYQEQLMQIAVAMPGYSFAEADILRKACGKKKIELMNREHTHFIEGSCKNGISEEVAEEVWGKMVKFASYAFNKSHAACYAYIGYITAYLSCHYPTEFYAAMLNAFVGNTDKQKAYLYQAKMRGIEFLPPDINSSELGFIPVKGQKAIRFGLGAITKVKSAAESIVEERANGEFEGLQDFFVRLNEGKAKVNSAAMENLIFSGAFSSFRTNKKELILFAEGLKSKKNKVLSGQIGLFAEQDFFPQSPEYPEEYLQKKEYEALGIYLSGHPAETLRGKAKEIKVCNLTMIGELENEAPVSICGIVRSLNIRYTKNGDQMMTFSIEDETGQIKCTVFPRDMEANRYNISESSIVLVIGDFKKDEDFGDQVIVKTTLDQNSISQCCELEEVRVKIRKKSDIAKISEKFKDSKGNTTLLLVSARTGDSRPLKHKVSLDPELIEYLKENYEIVS